MNIPNPLPGEKTRTDLWNARKSRSRAAGTGFVMSMSQDTPFLFSTDQASEFMLWSRLYALCSRDCYVEASVVTDVFGYPKRTAMRLLATLEGMGFIRRFRPARNGIGYIKVLGVPGDTFTRSLIAGQTGVWQGYMSRITPGEPEAPQVPSVAPRSAKNGTSYNKKKNLKKAYVRTPVRTHADACVREGWSTKDLMMVRFDEASGRSSDDVLSHTLFPEAPDDVLKEVLAQIVAQRATVGGATNLMLAAKMTDGGHIPGARTTRPDRVPELLQELIARSRERHSELLEALRNDLMRSGATSVRGAPANAPDVLLGTEKALLTARLQMLRTAGRPDLLNTTGFPTVVVAMFLWAADQSQAREFIARHENEIFSDIVGNAVLRNAMRSMQGFMAHIGLTADLLSEMVEDYQNDLLEKLHDLNTLEWRPTILQDDGSLETADD